MTVYLTPSEYKRKKLPERDETQMLVAANSRFEDMGAKRIHIMPSLDEPVFIRSRKKLVGLHVPTVDDANNLDLLEEYGLAMNRPLWVRAPFILPSSWAPWQLEAGRRYWLPNGRESIPYPTTVSKQKHWDWCHENLVDRQFIPHSLPEKFSEASDGDVKEMNVRLWDDARGPGHPERQAEIQGIALRALAEKRDLEEYAPILPTDRQSLYAQVHITPTADDEMKWYGGEEAIWAGILDDPDIDLFGLDVEESEAWDTTKNLFIESDNLLALKRLRRGYEGKVKLTYLDPPYNTGGKFVYNDNFKAQENTGSPFLGQRWARGTWLHCQKAPWVNASRLIPKELLEVDDTMLYPRSSDSPVEGPAS